MGDLTILDVGHGNAAVLRADSKVVVIDCGSNTLLRDYLLDEGISRVDIVLISHSDKDHTYGLHHILTNPSIIVGEIYVNPDQRRDDESWLDLSAVVKRARTIKGTTVVTALHQDCPGKIVLGDLEVTVLYPIPTDVLVSSKPNQNSAVVRIASRQAGEVILAGDVGATGLAELAATRADLEARVLVFPHHGGLPGRAEPFQFAKQLCELVRPDVVIFSQSRGSPNPLPGVVGGVRSAVPNAHIACTQLSQRCNAVPRHQLPHLSGQVAVGKATRECCMGTLRLRLPLGTSEPALESHLETVTGFASPMCLMEPDQLMATLRSQ